MNDFFNLPNPSSRTRPCDLLSVNRNECRKQKNNVLGNRARPVRETNLPSTVSRSSE
jgi:hypothetical protein